MASVWDMGKRCMGLWIFFLFFSCQAQSSGSAFTSSSHLEASSDSSLDSSSEGFSEPDSLLVALGEGISPSTLETHIRVLASKEYEGRETGSKGQRKAARYLSDYFSSLFLLPGGKGSTSSPYFQTFSLRRTTWERVEVRIGRRRYKHLDKMLYLGEGEHERFPRI